MFAKLLVLIISIAAVGAATLAQRHARLEAARELASARLHIRELDERLAEMRIRIARHVDPARVETLGDRIGATEPIIRMPGPLPSQPPARTNREGTDAHEAHADDAT